jgi:hypothetical protein
MSNFNHAANTNGNPFNPGDWNWSSPGTYLGLASGFMTGLKLAEPGLLEHLNNRMHKRNIKTIESQLLADAYIYDLRTRTLSSYTPDPGLGGFDLHFYFLGYETDVGTAFLAGNIGPFVAEGSNAINVIRTWQSNISTISSLHLPATGLLGYWLEPRGESTVRANQNRRVPEGQYLLTPNVNRYPDDFVIYNDVVPASRGITIHIGNNPDNTIGCPLPGRTWGQYHSEWGYNYVYSSRDMRNDLRNYINSVGYRNIRVNIFSLF